MLIASLIGTAVTLGVLLAALRGQRVTNANLQRDKQEFAARAARLIVVEQRQVRVGPTEKSVAILTNLGTEPILDIRNMQTQTLRIEDDPDNPGLQVHHINPDNAEVTVWRLDQMLRPDGEMALCVASRPEEFDGSRWDFEWTDVRGYRWANTFYGGPRQMPTMGELRLLRGPLGKGPKDGEVKRRHRFRNALMPYDYWPPQETIRNS